MLVAWGFTADGERVLLGVMLGMRESHADWLELAIALVRLWDSFETEAIASEWSLPRKAGTSGFTPEAFAALTACLS